MAYGGPNQFPVFLKAQADGSVTAEVRRFEDFVTGSMQRVARNVTSAAQQATAGFDFSRARKQVEDLGREIARLGKVKTSGFGDPFGIAGSVANLKNSPLQRHINEQSAAEEALDGQRRRAHAERIGQIQQEFDAAVTAIRARRDATVVAVNDMMERERSLGALRRQQAEEQRGLVGGREFIQAPGFDPAFAQQSAQAARAHAQALNQLAAAAEQVALKEGQATATDRAYATTLRESATAAGLEATRLEELAATQVRVAGATKGLVAANLALGQSQRGSRFASLQASQQFQDFFIQIGAGTNPMVAFSQQASQLAFVMSAAGGEAGKLAKLMSGGGGTVAFALLAVIPLVGLFINKLRDKGRAIDEAVEKMRKEAEQAAINAEAQDRWRKSIEGVTEAVKQQRAELDRLLKTEAASQVLAVKAAESNLNSLQNALTRTKQLYDQLGGAGREAELRKLIQQGPGAAGGEGGNLGATSRLSSELSELEKTAKKIANLQTTIDEASRNLTDSQIVLGQAQGEALANLSSQARRFHDQYLNALTGIIQRNPTFAPFTDQLTAGVEKVVNAMQRAAAVDVRFGDVAERAKQLGNDLDLGKTTVAKYSDEMGQLAANLNSVAEAAEKARKQQGQTLSTFGLPFARSTVKSGFGPRTAPTAGASSYHQGVDFAVPAGSAVRNPGTRGVVIHVGKLGGFGNAVLIDHGGGTISQYNHLATLSVTKGQTVDPGQAIGTVGSTGVSTGPHLDYRLKVKGKFVDPLKTSRVPTDETSVSLAAEKAADAATKAAEKAQREQDRLADAATRAAGRIASITEQWDEQPRLIDAAAKATRELDNTIANLNREKPPGYKDLIADAEQAKQVVQEGLLRPMQEITREAERQTQIDTLILQGREDEAEALTRIFALKDKIGETNEKDAQTILDIVRAEKQRERVLQQHEQLIQRAVQSAEVLQDAVTGILRDPFKTSSWKAGLNSILDDFRDNFAQSLSKGLLGDLGADFEDALRRKSDPLGAAGQDLTKSSVDLSRSAADLTQAASTLASAGGPSAGSLGATPTAFPSGLGSIFGDLFEPLSLSMDEILYGINGGFGDTGKKPAGDAGSLLSDPTQYYNLLGKTFGTQLDKFFGTSGIFSKIGGKLGTAMEGAAIGQQAGALLGLFGIEQGKGTQIGSAIGGAIGALIAGPIGSVIGGLLGGLAGSLFGGGKKKGSATIGDDVYGNLTVGDVSGQTSRSQESLKAANNVIDAVEAIAEQFDLLVDAIAGAVSVGVHGDDWRVDTEGRGRTSGDGVLNFGSDSQGAIEAAIKDLIEDGVIAGLREGTKKLIIEARNLQKGIEKALKFENVFKELKEYIDPVGAAIDNLNQEFDELRRIFAEAGASAEELAQLEQLYAFKRADALEAATERMNGALQDLLKDLTYRGDTGLSLRTREAEALTRLAPFEAAINAGQSIDQEEFAEIVRTLLEISREMYGSTSQYFDTLYRLTALTQQAIGNSGGTVTVPGVTTGVPGSGTAVPLPTGEVSGSPLTGAPGVPGDVAVANDNYSQTSRLIIAVNQQTEALMPLTYEEMVTAFRTALETASGVKTIPADANSGPINPYPNLMTGTGSSFGPGF